MKRNKMTKRTLILFCTVCVLLMLSTVPADALDPRDLTPAPAGTKVLLYNMYNYTGHETYRDGVKVDDNTSYTARLTTLEGVYYGALGNGIWAVRPILSFGDMSVDGSLTGNQEQSTSGIGDPAIAFAYWPYVNREKKSYFGMLLAATAPLGQYDNAKSVNIGSNVWSFKAEGGWLKKWGPLCLQVSGNAIVYTDNTEYSTNNLTREKDPLYTGEVWLSYDITKDLYVGGLYSYVNGGETSIEGVGSNNNKTKNHFLGAHIRYNLTPHLSLGVRFKENVDTENGERLNELVKVKLQYAW